VQHEKFLHVPFESGGGRAKIKIKKSKNRKSQKSKSAKFRVEPEGKRKVKNPIGRASRFQAFANKPEKPLP
jgi:hypothetical protein